MPAIESPNDFDLFGFIYLTQITDIFVITWIYKYFNSNYNGYCLI